jgi:RNA polymerase sigma-70 factor (ECF subfamily)
MTTFAKPEWDWTDVRALCLREARRVLGASSAADDAAQEAAIRAWRLRERCRNPARPNPWLTQIARNEALRLLHQKPVQTLEERDEPDPHEPDRLAVLDLRRELRAMDGQDVRLLIGRYWQDLPYSELAEQCGVAEATVRVKVHRLRLRLRNNLVEA